jgi:uroporphyrinogen decarboxylase
LGHGPFIFNLGHGVVPETPPEHVQALIDRVRRSGE